MAIEITGKLIDIESREQKQNDGSFKRSGNIVIKFKEKYFDGSMFDKTIRVFTKADTEVLQNSIGQEISLPVTFKQYKDKPGYFEYI